MMEKKTEFPSIRVRFETSQIAPSQMVAFPYVASVVGYGTIQYTAILFEKTLGEAMADIRAGWPDMVPHYTECGVGSFRDSDTATRSTIFGVVRVPGKPLGLLQKLRNWGNKKSEQSDTFKVPHSA